MKMNTICKIAVHSTLEARFYRQMMQSKSKKHNEKYKNRITNNRLI